MNKQLSVMGLAARASMVPVLIAAGLTALAVGALTYLANPEHTGGAAGVGAGAAGCRRGLSDGDGHAVPGGLRLRQPDGPTRFAACACGRSWWICGGRRTHAAMLLVLWALVATAALLGMQLKLQGLEPNWGVGPNP